MIVNKLLSVKKDKNIILYNLSYDTDRLYNFLKQIEDKYRRVENVVIETTFSGITPLSYGKYDAMKGICYVKEDGISDTKKERASESYFKSLGGTSREWDFLTPEERMLFMPIEGAKKGKLKLEVTYPSIVARTIKETFLTEDGKCIIDGTKMIKLGNALLNIPSRLIFDKTIDLQVGKKSWNDPSRAFFSIEDYKKYLRNAARGINYEVLEISEHEFKAAKKDFGALLYRLQDIISAEQIGMFPMDLELSEDLEILKRFGIRNETFEWLNTTLEKAPINYDGGQILGESRNLICNHYDLDGARKEKTIIEKIKRQEEAIGKIEEDYVAPVTGFTKKIKAA